MEKKKVPEIRLEGFEGEWESAKFGDIFSEYIEKDHAELPALTIIQGKGTIHRDDSDRNMQYDENSLSGYKMVKKDDFILHLRSFEGGLEKANTDGILSPAYHTFHAEGIDVNFYYLFLRSSDFINILLTPHIYGIRDGKSIDIEGMKTIMLPAPSLPEQKAIGEYFANLDNLVANAEDRHTKLLALKNSLLQKMFPQEGESVPRIRFEGFEGEWEFVKFGNIFNEYIEKNHAELPPLTIIQGKGTIHRDDSDRNMHYDKNSLSGYKMVKKDDFILHLRSFEGGLEKANTDGILSPAYHTFHAEEIDVNFYYLFLRTPVFINVLLAPHIYGIRDGKSIDVDGMKTIMLPMPKLSEQKAIGNYFTNLDTLIEAQEQKITKLRQMKSALLQKMFV